MSPAIRDTRGVAHRPDDELPSYLDAGEAARPTAVPVRVTARDVAGKVGQWVTEIVEGDGTMAPTMPLDQGGEGPKDDALVVHRVLGEPARLLAAFDRRWGAAPCRLRGAVGTLSLEAAPPADGPVRRVRGEMRLRLALVPMPVELEVVPWHTYGLVLSLRPDRRGSSAVPRHRRWSWFTASHRILDQMRRTLEAERG